MEVSYVVTLYMGDEDDTSALPTEGELNAVVANGLQDKGVAVIDVESERQ